MKYEVIESRAWKNAASGKLASVYGANPIGPGWAVVSLGWTVRNPHTGEVGACRVPWASKADAEAFAAKVKPSTMSIGA